MIFLLLLITATLNAFAGQPLRVAVIDTGLNLLDPRFSGHICKAGGEDLTGEGFDDRHGHGTHVAGLILKYAGNSPFCLMIYKYQGLRPTGDLTSASRERTAMQLAVMQGANIVNFSGGGSGFSQEEYLIIKSHPNVLFVVASGNQGNDLTQPGNEYYPASYSLPNVVAVGSRSSADGRISKYSNYAPKLVWEDGDRVVSTAIKSGTTVMSGTSMATAIRTGKLIFELTR